MRRETPEDSTVVEVDSPKVVILKTFPKLLPTPYPLGMTHGRVPGKACGRPRRVLPASLAGCLAD